MSGFANNSSLAGHTLAKSKIKENFNLLVVGIKDANGEFRFNPGPDTKIEIGDTVLVMGQVDDINRMKQKHT